MQLVIACSGHLLVDLPIFLGPVAVIGGWMLLTVRKDRAKRSRARSARA